MKIEINFFQLSFPPGNLPFWTRPLAVEEKLRFGERYWGLRGELRDETNRFAVFFEGEPVSSDYSQRDEDPMKVNPFLIRLALEASLRKKLRKLDYQLNVEKTSTAFFHRDRKYQGAPDFLTVLRGFECRADLLDQNSVLYYGFFISTRSRVAFANSLDDPVMAKLAPDRDVLVQDKTDTHHGHLVKIDPGSRKAAISMGRTTRDFPLKQIYLQGNSANITAYCKTTRRQQEARKAILAGQFANDRLGMGGSKNPRWLRNQAEAVSIWLDALSEEGFVPIEWAFGTQVLRLQPRPSQIQPRDHQ